MFTGFNPPLLVVEEEKHRRDAGSMQKAENNKEAEMDTITLPSTTSYPEQLTRIQGNMSRLSQREPETMSAFSSLHEAAAEPGVLDFKTKELIALAIAVSLRCDGCIAFHTHDALEAGASPEEIMEALSVAILMGGGPSVIYATHVAEALEQFEAP
jgi:AhpD family alkylhydroperoxidase